MPKYYATGVRWGRPFLIEISAKDSSTARRKIARLEGVASPSIIMRNPIVNPWLVRVGREGALYHTRWGAMGAVKGKGGGLVTIMPWGQFVPMMPSKRKPGRPKKSETPSTEDVWSANPGPPAGYRREGRTCLVCGKEIVGYKPIGSTDIRSRQGRNVGDAIRYDGQMGYAHLVCKEEARKRGWKSNPWLVLSGGRRGGKIIGTYPTAIQASVAAAQVGGRTQHVPMFGFGKPKELGGFSKRVGTFTGGSFAIGRGIKEMASAFRRKS